MNTTTPATSESFTSPIENLQKEFRSLLVLLILVTNINRGRPVLQSKPAGLNQRNLDRRRAGAARKDHARLLSALASLMVREREVVATTANIIAAQTGPGVSVLITAVISTDDQMLGPKFEGAPYKVSLNDHIATLLEYLKLYRGRPKEQSSLFRKFAEKLLVVCRSKMSQRMRHWSSCGFLYCLQTVKDDFEGISSDQSKYKARCEKFFQQTLREAKLDEFSIHDKALASCAVQVVGVEQNEFVRQLFKAMSQAHTSSAAAATFPRFHEYYNSSTFVDFHRLLVLTLEGYRDTLEDLITMMKPGSSTPRRCLRATASKLFLRAQLLWTISRSGVLPLHLDMLADMGALVMPRVHLGPMYKSKSRNKSRSPGQRKADDDGNADNNEVEFEKETQVSSGNNGSRVGGDNQGDSEDEDHGEEDLVHPEDPDPDDHCSGAFQRWMNLLVRHLESLHLLSVISKSGKFILNPCNFSLVTVQKPRDLDTEPWVDTVKKACDAAGVDTGLEYDETLATLQTEIEQIEKGDMDLRRRIFSDLHIKGSKIPSRLPFHGTVHCEAILGSLCHYSPTNNDSEGMKAVVWNLQVTKYHIYLYSEI